MKIRMKQLNAPILILVHKLTIIEVPRGVVPNTVSAVVHTNCQLDCGKWDCYSYCYVEFESKRGYEESLEEHLDTTSFGASACNKAMAAQILHNC